METIDNSILKKGYSIYRTEAGRYFGMSDDEVTRIHIKSNGKPYYELDDAITVSVIELVLQPNKTIVILNEDRITLMANQLIPVPVRQ